MSKKLLDIDPWSGIKTYHDYDHSTGLTKIERVQNVEPILDMNKRLQNTDHEKKGIKNCWWHAAMIPIIIQEKWLNEHGVDIYKKEHWPRVRKLLNDPDYRYLRTGRGRV